MPAISIQTSFVSGELSPGLLGHTDLAKYHSGAALMQNFFVDVKGGASTRPGTQYIGGIATAGILVPFVFSATQTYMLLFTANALQFIRNPLTVPYPNSSNAGFILSGGIPYSIVTLYAAVDLPLLKFSQSGDLMTITHPSYPRYELKRIADTNWTLTQTPITLSLLSPTGPAAAISGLPAGSTDTQTTSYLYAITSVDANGQESAPPTYIGITGINLQTTPGSITLSWTAVAGAKYYNVYKALPVVGGTAVARIVEAGAGFGFAGFANGPAFTDSNITADFSQTPPQNNYPFTLGTITGYTITNPGAAYPVGGTTLTVTGAGGATAVALPILSTNIVGATGTIIGMVIVEPGYGITNGAAVTAAGGGGAGFAATVQTLTGTINPAVSAYFQQRQLFASTNNRPLTIFGSRPGFYNNFQKSNPIRDSDSYEFTLAAQQINAIKHMIPMPGGLVLFSDSGVTQLTGGSANPNNPSAVTPSSAVIVPQSYFGASDLKPIVINYDILFNQSEGSLVRKLTYNFFVNIYTGTDLTVLASHLFYPHYLASWAYQDSPFKIVWCVREDGVLLSLTYLPEQEILAWTQHNTNGLFEQVAVVREGTLNAVYFIVNRNGNRFVERLCDRIYTDVTDAWCLDAALSYQGAPATVMSGLSHLEGKTVYALADGIARGPFVVAAGQITLPVAASKVVIGLAFTAKLQTMPLDEGQPTLQGRRKTVDGVTLRVRDTANLKWGPTFATADLTLYRPGISFTGNALTTSVSGLTTGDMPLNINAKHTTLTQFCVQQDGPFPATVLAAIITFNAGDTPSR